MTNFWQELPKPFLVLAPMEDVTDFVFREIFLTLPRPDVLFTEFISAEGIIYGTHDRVMQRLKYSKEQHPIVAQIWGNKPEILYKASEIVSNLGFDGVDINMGCPDRIVVKNGCGAGLIGNYSLVGEIISAVKEGSKNISVSVKTRIAKNSIDTEKWTSFLLGQQINALTIHARTISQKFTTPANWEEIGKIAELKNKIAKDTVIIGNGDINDYADTLKVYKKYSIDGAMIGRGIFSNPWAFEKVETKKERHKKDYIEILIKHLNLFDQTWGDTKDFQIMKKFFKMYIREFKGADLLRKELMSYKDLLQAKNLLIEELNSTKD